MKLSWLFSLVLFMAAAAMSRVAGAQDLPSTRPIEPIQLTEPTQPPQLLQPTTQPVLDTPTLSNSQIEKSFDDLASAEPDVREAARVALLGLSRDQLPALREVVRRAAPVAPAQTAALRDIVVHVFLAGEPYEGLHTGFMGVMLPPPPGLIQFGLVPPLPPPQGGIDDAADADDGDAGVTIQDCMAGFCGYRYLRPGDLIIGVQADAPDAPDQFLRTMSDQTLIAEVSRHPPGSPLTLRLIRQGRMIDVTVVLSDKPKALELHEMHIVDEWREERRKMAQDYWQTVFEPLLGPHVS